MMLRVFKDWKWVLAFRHYKSVHTRPGVKWINNFAFLGILVGVFAWTSLISIMSGLQSSRRNQVLSEKPHWVWEGPPTEALLDKVELLNSNLEIQAQTGIIKAEAQLVTEGILEVPKPGQQGRIYGSGVIIEGLRQLPAGVVILGSALVKSFKIQPNDTLNLFSAWYIKSPPFGFDKWTEFTTGYQEYDRARVQMSSQDLQDWLGIGPAFSKIDIRLADPENIQESQRQFLQEHFGLQFKSWKEIDSALWYSHKLEKYMMSFLVGFVFLLALIALYISMAVKVNEKLREAALLSALGAKKNDIFKVFLLEGGMIGFKGGVMGLAFSWIFCQIVSRFVRMPEFYYDRSIPIDWNVYVNVSFLAVCWLVCLWVSYLPSRRLRQVETASLLRS
jgi:lipoprotein-releasing system permease protein